MALKIKVTTKFMPNLSINNVEELERDLEETIKHKLNDGFDLLQACGGDSYVILIFKKEE